MLTEIKKEIVKTIEKLIYKYPDLRVGQMVFNYICSRCPNNDPFFIPDEKLLEILKETLKKEF